MAIKILFSAKIIITNIKLQHCDLKLTFKN